jgi:prepilin-type N-terminal cleavage/methylation domain-containing protein
MNTKEHEPVPHRDRGDRSPAFTLVEMLVVVAVIALLAGLLLPALGTATAKARSIRCLSNLRQIGVGVALYSHDNDDVLPQSSHQRSSWIGSLAPYGVTSTYTCPVDTNRLRITSYALNDYLTARPFGASHLGFHRLTRIPSPAETAHILEARGDFEGSDHFHFVTRTESPPTLASYASQVAVEHHRSSANHLFADSHVEALSWIRVQRELRTDGSRFLHPSGHVFRP